MDRGISVGIATTLRAGRSWDRIPLAGRDFPHPSMGPIHPHVQYVPDLFPEGGGGKAAGTWCQSPTSSPKVKERVELYLCASLRAKFEST